MSVVCSATFFQVKNWSARFLPFWPHFLAFSGSFSIAFVPHAMSAGSSPLTWIPVWSGPEGMTCSLKPTTPCAPTTIGFSMAIASRLTIPNGS